MNYLKYLLLFVSVFVSCGMSAQTESETGKDSVSMICRCDSLYRRICPERPIIFGGHPQRLPQFSGGYKAMYQWLSENLQYPKEAAEKGIQGRVVVKYIIDESGKIICPYVHISLHPALDEEALRIVKLMPDWEPAVDNDTPRKMCYTLPVLFKN